MSETNTPASVQDPFKRYDEKLPNDYSDMYNFIANFDVIGSIIGIAVGLSGHNVLSSLVEGIIMPIFTPLLTGTSIDNLNIEMGVFKLDFGPFLKNLVSLIIILLVLFFIIQKVFKKYLNIIIGEVKMHERYTRAYSVAMHDQLKQMNRDIRKTVS